MQQSGRRLAEIPVSGSYLPSRQIIAPSAASPAGLHPAPQPYPGYDVLKRFLDLLIATVLLAAALPLLMTACLVIWLSTREAPVLAQRRVGYLGHEFPMLKLRTMRVCRDDLMETCTSVI